MNGLHPQGEYGSHDVTGERSRSMISVTGFSPACDAWNTTVSFILYIFSFLFNLKPLSKCAKGKKREGVTL